jgi:hypothetical protein
MNRDFGRGKVQLLIFIKNGEVEHFFTAIIILNILKNQNGGLLCKN